MTTDSLGKWKYQVAGSGIRRGHEQHWGGVQRSQNDLARGDTQSPEAEGVAGTSYTWDEATWTTKRCGKGKHSVAGSGIGRGREQHRGRGQPDSKSRPKPLARGNTQLLGGVRPTRSKSRWPVETLRGGERNRERARATQERSPTRPRTTWQWETLSVW